jgi:O-antigen/teichoic acid export membrane protein
MKLRTSLKNSVFRTTLSNAMILAANATTGVVSARALGPTGRGQVAIVVLWTALVQILGNLGVPSACSYYIARWPNRQAAIALWVLRISLVQCCVMTFVSGVLLWWLHIRLRIPVLLTYEFIIWAAASSLTLYGACHAQGVASFARFNFLRTAPSMATAILMVCLTLIGRLTSAEAGATYLLPTLITSIVAVFWLWTAAKSPLESPLAKHERKAMWSYSLRSVASFSGLALNRNADQIILGLLVPVGALGIYTVASAASSPLPALVASLGMVGLPKVAALTGKEKSNATWKIARRGTYFLAVASPLLAVTLPWAIPFVYGPQYASAVLPAEILLLGTVFAALATVIDDLLRAHGHPGFVSVTQGAGGIVTLIGAAMLGGHPLTAIAAVSSLGFLVALVMALLRLRVATGAQSRKTAPIALLISDSD